jgi:hypothetical protein
MGVATAEGNSAKGGAKLVEFARRILMAPKPLARATTDRQDVMFTAHSSILTNGGRTRRDRVFHVLIIQAARATPARFTVVTLCAGGCCAASC